MKKIGVLTALLAICLSISASAFQVEPADFAMKERTASTESHKEFLKNFQKTVDGYEMEFEYNGEVMVIHCPHDGGISQFEVTQKKPALIKSNDTCEHEVAFEVRGKGNEFTFYQDDIPYLLAEDYCRWRYSGKGALRYTWKIHSVLKRVRVEK